MALERRHCELYQCEIYHTQLEAILNTKEMEFVIEGNTTFASLVIL